MDSGSTVTTAASSTSKYKLSKRQKSNEGKDIISNLPESIISRILSCLPTKDAVRTSVLSKRWIYRWTSITKLELDDSVFFSRKKKTGKQHFVNFMNRSLLLTKCSRMESFSLVISNKYDQSLVNTWISNMLNRGVKNLNIHSHLEFAFSAFSSDSLWNSHSLEILVLKMYHCAIRVPTSFVSLRNLKSLKLSGITFSLYYSNSKYLNLYLPVLKKFKTQNCTWVSVNSVTLAVPLLERVFIKETDKSLCYKSHNCEIKFSTSPGRLTEFTYSGYISQNIVMLNPSSANDAVANIILHKREEEAVQAAGIRGCKLLKQFSQVKCLKLEGTEILAQSKISLADLPSFKMLRHLELGLVTGEILLSFLLKSPSLKTLVLKGVSNFETEILTSATVPECLLSTLQVVKFEKVTGKEHELALAKFVMENALVLQRMSFCHPFWLSNWKGIEEFKEKLLSFKKGFSCAIIDFSYSSQY